MACGGCGLTRERLINSVRTTVRELREHAD